MVLSLLYILLVGLLCLTLGVVALMPARRDMPTSSDTPDEQLMKIVRLGSADVRRYTHRDAEGRKVRTWALTDPRTGAAWSITKTYGDRR